MIRARLIAPASVDHFLIIERVNDGHFFDWGAGKFAAGKDRGLFRAYQTVKGYKFLESKVDDIKEFSNADFSFLVLSTWGWPLPVNILSMQTAYIKEPPYGVRTANLLITITSPKPTQ